MNKSFHSTLNFFCPCKKIGIKISSKLGSVKDGCLEEMEWEKSEEKNMERIAVVVVPLVGICGGYI